MKHSLSALALAVTVVLAGLNGCTSTPNAEAIYTLSVSIAAVEEAQLDLAALPVEAIDEARNWAISEFRELELLVTDTAITITRAEANIVGEVGRARRALKDQVSRRQSLADAGTRTHQQLHTLIQALAKEATVDGKGSTIDSAYIATNVLKETEVATAFCNEVTETQRLAQMGQDLVEASRPSVDSLKQELRSRLAAIIVERAK